MGNNPNPANFIFPTLKKQNGANVGIRNASPLAGTSSYRVAIQYGGDSGARIFVSFYRLLKKMSTACM